MALKITEVIFAKIQKKEEQRAKMEFHIKSSLREQVKTKTDEIERDIKRKTSTSEKDLCQYGCTMQKLCGEIPESYKKQDKDVIVCGICDDCDLEKHPYYFNCEEHEYDICRYCAARVLTELYGSVENKEYMDNLNPLNHFLIHFEGPLSVKEGDSDKSQCYVDIGQQQQPPNNDEMQVEESQA